MIAALSVGVFLILLIIVGLFHPNDALIGSPVGFVGSEEQRSLLTKFITDHPRGGIIRIEEADYLHQDVIQLLTNMITDRKFTDGIGKEWDMSNFVIMANSNIGQSFMVPPDSRNPMTWEQYNARRRDLTNAVSENGKVIEKIKTPRLKQIFDQFIHTIVTKSNPNDDTSSVSQRANKQSRRWIPTYLMSPNREELLQAARSQVAQFVKNAKPTTALNST